MGKLNLKNEYLDDQRQSGDKEADRVIKNIMGNNAKEELYAYFKIETSSSPALNHIKNPVLKSFIDKGYAFPKWADQDLMEEGASFFRRNSNEFLFMLGIVSLPYCYAGSNGAKVLYRSDKIRKNTHLRLLDTTSFVLSMMEPGGFGPSGNARFLIRQVQLRHALSRYYLAMVPEVKALNEVPINQEDMAGTNLAFSYIILKSLPKIGVYPTSEEKAAYLHLWAVIGYQMGIKEELLPKNMLEAYQLEKKIASRHFRTSKEGVELTQQLIRYYEKEIPNSATVFLIRPLIRHLLGRKISEIIGIKSTFIPGIQSLMKLLPFFKKFIFPPNEEYEKVRLQVEKQRANLAG